MIKKVILIIVITLFSNIILSQNLVNQTDSSFLKLKEFPNNTQFSIALIKDSVFQFIGFNFFWKRKGKGKLVSRTLPNFFFPIPNLF